MFDLSPLQCVGLRKEWFPSSKDGKNQGCDGWGASIEVPTPCSGKHRRSIGGAEDKYTDGEVEIDRRGLRFLQQGDEKGCEEVSSEWAKMLAAAQKPRAAQQQQHDDDTLSVASTHVDEDSHYPAARSRLASSASSQRSSDISSEEVAWLRKVNNRVVTAEEKKAAFERQGKRPVKYENIVKICKIGKGSSGNVWRCMDTSTRESLAVKEVPVHDDEEKAQMAVRELVTLYGVDHEGVVTCHEVFFSRGSFHIVMEMMDGGSLLDAMRRARDSMGSYCGLGAHALAAVGSSVCQALEFLHEELQVVHRDVKPGNILLTSNGQVKLADLGICTNPGSVQASSEAEDLASTDGRATPATEWIGTVTYMSPERLVGDAYGFNADIWSLGIVLIEAAIGGYPLAPAENGRSLQFWDLLDRVLSGPCPSEALRGKGAEWAQLRSFAAMCLDKDVETRAMARDIKTHPFLAKADSYYLARWVRKFLANGSLEADNDGWA